LTVIRGRRLGAFVAAPTAQTPRVRASERHHRRAGFLAGHATIVQGTGALKIGEGPVRTGVTAVLPRKDIWFTLNGDCETTGTHWIRDRETLMHPDFPPSVIADGALGSRGAELTHMTTHRETEVCNRRATRISTRHSRRA
jgi:hypothetical protein